MGWFLKEAKQPVDSVSEELEEALVVLLSHLEEAVKQQLAVPRGEPVDVDLVADDAAVLHHLPEDALPHAVVGGQLLQRRPLEVLLVFPFLAPAPPEQVRRVPEGGPPAPSAAADHRSGAAAAPSSLLFVVLDRHALHWIALHGYL